MIYGFPWNPIGTLEESVRPAGLEPATFGSGGLGKETTGGSGKPLPPFFLRIVTIRGNTRTP